MRAALSFLIAAAAAVAVAWGISLLPGAVTVSLGTRTYQASVPISVLLAGLAFTALYVLFRLLGALLRVPSGTRHWRAGKTRERGEDAVTRALVALAAGDALVAQREAERARASLGDQPVTLLLSASAARLAGREDIAQAAFQALAARRDSSFLGLRGLLRQAATRGDPDAAADLARRAEIVQPGAAWLRTERLQDALRTSAWQDALRLAPPDQPEQRVALTITAAEAATDPAEAMRLARSAWNADPKLAPAALAYARRLRQAGKERAAQAGLRRAWAATPYPGLAALALESVAEPLARVKAAQAFVAGAQLLPDSHLLVACLALEAGLLGEARRHLQAAAQAGLREQRLSSLRADLAEAEGDPAASRDALREAAMAAPDPAWRCAVCDTVLPAWRPVCSVCGATGSLAWRASSSAQRQLSRPIDAQDVEALP